MAWLPDGEKILKISLFVLTQLTTVTDTNTHRHTPHDGMGRAYASHRAAKIKDLNLNYKRGKINLWYVTARLI